MQPKSTEGTTTPRDVEPPVPPRDRGFAARLNELDREKVGLRPLMEPAWVRVGVEAVDPPRSDEGGASTAGCVRAETYLLAKIAVAHPGVVGQVLQDVGVDVIERHRRHSATPGSERSEGTP